ncbi:MAG: NAD(P)/FAD-dependent oxidoreductase [Flavobacteriales bacterium]
MDGYDPETWKKHASRASGISMGEIKSVIPLKRSVDARGKQIKVLLKLAIVKGNDEFPELLYPIKKQQVAGASEVHIIGTGPAGLFAAVKLIELGLKPILWERGNDVRKRRFDIAALSKNGVVNPDSNYCFGEGGAGTYSDGKLYTRSTKRGDVKQVLSWLVQMGASDDILYEAHPHIGTNKLPDIITQIRQTILECGGEVNFQSPVTGIKRSSEKITSIQINNANWISVNCVLLATGHSARDIFEILHKEKIVIEYKPFALGVRVEHPQQLIDELRYRCETRPEQLPAASYHWTEQVDDYGVYSFCMCPGGIIAPCATAQEEVVTNGWSPSKRNNPFANSGIVVSVDEKLLKKYGDENALKGVLFQQEIEHNAWNAGGKNQFAPAENLENFCNGKSSSHLPACSYRPGVSNASLKEVLPEYIYTALREAFKRVDKKMKGYVSRDAIVVGVESRTSSPVRIPRDNQTGMHPQITGLFPCGEGGGYAGGIVSAAIDGINQAEKIYDYFKS